MPAGGGGKRSPQVLPELFGAPSGGKTQGRCQGGSPADFLLGPQASTELVGPPEGQIKGSTGRSGSAADLLRGPQASTGSTGEKLQGKTGQGVSAADFFRPLERPARPSGTTRSARRQGSAHRDETRWLTEPRAHSPRPPAPTPHDGKATGERRRRRRGTMAAQRMVEANVSAARRPDAASAAATNNEAAASAAKARGCGKHHKALVCPCVTKAA
jgi:hypothetical protein